MKFKLWIIVAVFMLSGCVSGSVAFEKQAPEDTSNVDAAIVEKKNILVEKEDPDAVAATIKVQCEETWLPYYNRAKAIIENKHPDSEIEIIVMDSMDHINMISNYEEHIDETADVFSMPLEEMKPLVTEGKLAPLNVSFISSNVGFNKSVSLRDSMAFEGRYYGYTMGIECQVAYINQSNATEYGIDPSLPFDIARQDKNVVVMPMYEKAYLKYLSSNPDLRIYYENTEGEFTSDLLTPYEELNPNAQSLMNSLYNYWAMYTDTSLWEKGVGINLMNERFALGLDGSIVRLGTSDLSEMDLSTKSNVIAVPLRNVTFDGNELLNWQDGWSYSMSSAIVDDEEKKLLAELYISELLNPAYASDFYTATGKIMEHASADDFVSLDRLNYSIIETVLGSFDDAKDAEFQEDMVQDDGYALFEKSLLAWQIEQPTSAEAAYTNLSEKFAEVLITEEVAEEVTE